MRRVIRGAGGISLASRGLESSSSPGGTLMLIELCTTHVRVGAVWIIAFSRFKVRVAKFDDFGGRGDIRF